MTQARFTFGPLTQTDSWEFTLGPGIEPSALTTTFLTAQVEQLASPIQNLTISQDSYDSFTLSDCHLVSARTSSRAKLTNCTILDRRWRWQYAYIDGHYNVRKPDGVYIREKSPRQLAALLFDSMIELNYDVSGLPDDEAKPEVNWQSANSAQELGSLCQAFGCYPTLNPITDRAEIHAIGSGPGLPTGGPIIHQSQVISVKPLPKTIRIVGGPSLFQTRLTLGEALAEEPDGELKPMVAPSGETISGVSYLKALGEFNGRPNWQREFPGAFNGIDDAATYMREGKTLKLRDLAAASCYRIYRITGQASAANGATGADLWSPAILNVPPAQGQPDVAPTKLSEILPLRTTKLTTHTDPEGRLLDNPADVYGTFTISPQFSAGRENVLAGYIAPDGAKYKGGFSIDAAKGIVRFNEPVLILHDEGPDKNDPWHEPAKLELETSYPVNKDGVFARYEEFVENSDPSAFGSYRLAKPEMVVRVIETDPPTDNITLISQAGQKYLQRLQEKFTLQAGIEAEYPYIRALALDGLIRQITWRGGGGAPATTKVSLNMEHNPYIPKWEKIGEEILRRGQIDSRYQQLAVSLYGRETTA